MVSNFGILLPLSAAAGPAVPIPFMRRKTKTLATRVVLRKAATSATAAARRPFPAWIDAGERGVAFSAAVVSPRVRDGLVLRTVAQAKSARSAKLPDARDAR